jgi:hypothetical protein
MFSKKIKAGVAIATFGVSVCLVAQVPNPTAVDPGAKQHVDVVTEGPNGIYVYNVKVVDRELPAVNYINRNGATHIGFAGTSLLPSAKGDAKVESVTGKTKISARFEGLTPANGFGPEYLTYVLWAISSDGRPQNLGELELAGNKANLDATSSFQSFGLMVTAEPYYSVSVPSDVIVLQNVFTDKTQGVLQTVNIHYSLLPKGIYAPTDGSKSVWNPITDREHVPLALYEAHNAARIAKAAGADKYAPDIMAEVATDLQNADAEQSNKHRDVHMEFTDARQATQRAEDARIVTLRKELHSVRRKRRKPNSQPNRMQPHRSSRQLSRNSRPMQPQPRRPRLKPPRPRQMPKPPTLAQQQPRLRTRPRPLRRMLPLLARSFALSSTPCSPPVKALAA